MGRKKNKLKPRIVFLHSELAKYFIACVESLAEKAEVTIIHWPVNPEAPFKFKSSSSIELIEKDSLNETELNQRIMDISPDLIVISGWRDKDYMKVIPKLGKSILKVIALDNHWKGSAKQIIWSKIFRTKYKKHFDFCWVPGSLQEEYALKLGFDPLHILKDLYSCDVLYFNSIYHSKKQKRLDRPRRFLYIGRYAHEKGIFNLWRAFTELVEEGKLDWELWCLGTGPEYENRTLHSNIRHFGFVQPENMKEVLEQVDVFVLPSTYEPWGLVVHEMACTGMPLVMSEKVGAIEKFLVKEQNGCIFNPDSIQELKSSLQKISEKTDNEMIEMSEMSYQLSNQVTPSTWRETLLEIL